jgi:hypothetical protein
MEAKETLKGIVSAVHGYYQNVGSATRYGRRAAESTGKP